MYVPAEGVYSEIIGTRNATAGGESLDAYARNRKVIPVSPNSFYAYLCTIVYGLKGMQIERQAQEIRGQIAQVQRSFELFFVSFDGIDKAIGQARKRFDEAAKRGDRLRGKMERITGESAELRIEKDPARGEISGPRSGEAAG